MFERLVEGYGHVSVSWDYEINKYNWYNKFLIPRVHL